MKVLSVASECAPLIKTGGLADVVGALPGALAAEGVEMRVMLPAYPGLAERLEGAKAQPLGDGERLIAGRAGGIETLLYDAPALFARAGRGPYLAPDGRDWPDNALRFGRFAAAAARVAREGVGGWRPDVVHGHDWQAGPVAAFLGGEGPASVFTAHNVAFQGRFAREVMGLLGLPEALFTIDGIEFHGGVGFLKAGLALSDRLTTVSPTYARELTTPEFGEGLDGLFRARAGVFEGVLNGIDLAIWNPAADPALPAAFDADDLSGKAVCRRALAERFGIPPPEGPLVCVISRLTRQKGLDLLADALPALLAEGGALVALGSGDADLEEALRGWAAAHPGRVAVEIGYDEPLAHLMQGGSDAILVPSRFEPCGLTQLCALRYGTVPVVARTGGLADTVIEANPAALAVGAATGLVHAPGSAAALADALRRLGALWRDEAAWAALRRAALRQPVGWERSAARYAAIYREAVAARGDA